MKASIIVTDLTQMGGKRVCVAGYLNESVCVRPIFEPDGLTKDWLFKDNQVIIQPFSIVEFDFDYKDKINIKKPHTEDWILRSSYCINQGLLTSDKKRSFLAKIDNGYVSKIFGTDILCGPGWFIRTGEGERSLGTISNPKILEIIYGLREGKFEYRISFADRSGARYNLAITDLSFRYFLDHLYFQEMMDTKDASKFVANKLQEAEMLFIRIGLARGNWDKYPNRCYLQVNGIYSFPDYLSAGTFADFELSERELVKRYKAKKPINANESNVSNPFNTSLSAIMTTDTVSCDYNENLAKIKAAYPKAYEYWSEDEDNKLKELARSGQTVHDIADRLQRQPSAIRSRIKKLDINNKLHMCDECVNDPIKKLDKSANDKKILENAYAIHLQILQLQRQIKNLSREYEIYIETAKKLRISQQGLYELTLVTRKTRKVDINIFKELYPEIFIKLASIPVQAAEKEVGSSALDKAITYIVRESYVITKKDT